MAEIAARLPAMGYLPDLPSIRDYSVETVKVSAVRQALNEKPVSTLLKAVGVDKAAAELPATVDLRQWCPAIEDQQTIGSCTAQAGVALIEFFENRAYGTYIDASRLFLYKVTRRLAHLEGDSGAYLRTTMEALTAFGAPPEEYWPYDVARFDEEPSAFCYAFGQNYKAITYYRLDQPGMTGKKLLARIRTNLAASLPAMFGFTVYDSIRQAADSGGRIPFPYQGDRVVGGHAVVAVGYDDQMVVRHGREGAPTSTGALLIRNSWGPGWGEGGYGWLPYEYVLQELAVDWWSVLKTGWIDTGQFRLPS